MSDINAASSTTHDQQRDAISSLLDSGNFSDITIGCEGTVFKAHKAILCPRSEYFFKAFTASMQEKSTGHIEFYGKEAPVIHAVLSYLYKGEYSPVGLESKVPTDEVVSNGNTQGDIEAKNASETGNVSDYKPMLFNTKVYAAATEYSIPGLRNLASAKFTENESTCFSPGDFLQAVIVMKHDIPEQHNGMWEAAITIAGARIEVLRLDENWPNILQEAPEFVDRVAKLLHQYYVRGKAEFHQQKLNHQAELQKQIATHRSQMQQQSNAHRAQILRISAESQGGTQAVPLSSSVWPSKR